MVPSRNVLLSMCLALIFIGVLIWRISSQPEARRQLAREMALQNQDFEQVHPPTNAPLLPTDDVFSGQRPVLVRALAPRPGFTSPSGYRVEDVELPGSLPGVFVEFLRWAQTYAQADPVGREALLVEGLHLAEIRSEALGALIRENPQAAILLTPPPVVRNQLPREIASQLEEIVAGRGFYGVKAVCSHGSDASHDSGCRIEHDAIIDGTVYKASIYGSRRERLSEEDASLFGVAHAEWVALHENDYVVFPAEDLTSDPAFAGQFAVIHKGQTTYFHDRAALEAHFISQSP